MQSLLFWPDNLKKSVKVEKGRRPGASKQFPLFAQAAGQKSSF